MWSTSLDAASVNSAVISRGAADCATARGAGTRTSLFGSIAQRFKALQSAAGSSHGTIGGSRELSWRGFEFANGKRGGLAGEASAGKGLEVGSWGALTCSRYWPSTPKVHFETRDYGRVPTTDSRDFEMDDEEQGDLKLCLSRQILSCYTCTKSSLSSPGSL